MTTQTTRRAALVGAAALPAMSLPAMPGTDPVFAAIEKYRAAKRAFMARCDYERDLEESGCKLTPAPNDHRTPEIAAIVKLHIAARAELAKTAPTTLAGMVAYLEYASLESDKLDELLFEGSDGVSGENDARNFLQSLSHAARQIAREAVRS